LNIQAKPVLLLVKTIVLIILPSLLISACGQTLTFPTVPPTVPAWTATTSQVEDVAGVPSTVPFPTPTPEPPLAARVNGVPIYLADYEREVGQYEAALRVQGVDPNTPEGQESVARHQEWILNMMIEQVLIEQAAAAQGITVSDEEVNLHVQAMIADSGGEEAFDARLAEMGETREDVWRKARAQLIGMKMTQRVIDSVPKTAEHVHARHILVDTKEEAERILAQLQAGADFATLAMTYSRDVSTRDTGGDLGFFPRGILIAPEVEAVAFALQPGQFSGVVQSMLGYHIVQVVERDPARPVSQENLSILEARALDEWIAGLWAQAVVERFVNTAP